MATSTTQSIWRSGGGDTTKTAYAGSMLMAADFYFLPTAAAATKVQKSSTDTANVILPIGVVITEIQVNAAATGGVDPTFDLSFTTYTSGTVGVARLINEGDADAGKQTFTWATGSAGTYLGVAMSATEMVYITGNVGASAATGGSVSGRLFYYVPTNGAYTA